ATSGRQTHKDLERIVNQPLQTREGTNHDNPDWQSVPQTHESNVLVDSGHGTAERFSGLAVGIELADHDVGRMGDDGAENTGEITTSEGDGGLHALAVVGLGTRKIGVDLFDNGFKGCKLHHCV